MQSPELLMVAGQRAKPSYLGLRSVLLQTRERDGVQGPVPGHLDVRGDPSWPGEAWLPRRPAGGRGAWAWPLRSFAM